MLSIIIPSRQPQYLQKTIDDLLIKAEGEVEIIVVLDGYWPDPLLKDDKRVRIIHHGTVHDSLGMRHSINQGVAVSKGEFIMKTDEHCMFSQGFDKRLGGICQEDWLIVPRRYRLDPDKWEIIHDHRPPVDYMMTDFPFQRPYDRTCGLHGAEDRERYEERKDIEVDDLMTMQGSCYFLKKYYWEKLFPNGLDDKNYGSFTQEAQELSMTVWLSGGRVVVDKGCFYAHFHKGSRGKGYGFSTAQYKRHEEESERGRLYAIEYWLNVKSFKYDFEWLLKKFWPLRGWKDTWKDDIVEGRKTDFSTLKYKDDFWLQGLKKDD